MFPMTRPSNALRGLGLKSIGWNGMLNLLAERYKLHDAACAALEREAV